MEKYYNFGKLACPCLLRTIIDDKIKTYTGMVLPWDDKTAYSESIIDKYKAMNKDIKFILFYSSEDYGYDSYRIMSIYNNKESADMIKNIYKILSDKNNQSSESIINANTLKINEHKTIMITTPIHELFTSDQAFSINDNELSPSQPQSVLIVKVRHNKTDPLGVKTINHICVILVNSSQDL